MRPMITSFASSISLLGEAEVLEEVEARLAHPLRRDAEALVGLLAEHPRAEREARARRRRASAALDLRELVVVEARAA